MVGFMKACKIIMSKNVFLSRLKTSRYPILAFAAVLLMLLPAGMTHLPSYSAVPSALNSTMVALSSSRFDTVPASVINNSLKINDTGPASVMIGFKMQNQQGLDNLLSALQNPSSPQYHKYISRSQFSADFSWSAPSYERAVAYFGSYPGVQVTGYSDRMAIELTGNSVEVSRALGSGVSYYSLNGGSFYEFSNPSLPAWIADNVSYVAGLQNYSKASYVGGGSASPDATPNATSLANGYLLPVGAGYSAYIWGSDLQKAYNVSGILNETNLSSTVIADIFWTDYGYAPYYPRDVSTYLNETLPAWEAKPVIRGAPLDGAMAPGLSAQNNTLDTTLENTLDLEMLGSLSPGSTIYDVYTPGNALSFLDSSLAYILNPGNSSSPLNNVSVVSNSWYTVDTTDQLWSQYLEEAAARGITVVACSGDSGDNPVSYKAVGTDAAYPGSDAGSTSGMLSVGGANISLNVDPGSSSFLHMNGAEAWYISSNTENNPTPVGSEGGVSNIYPEPSWQVNSVANGILDGKGRGVPDISAIANNVILFMTVDGTSYYGSPQFYYSWGTSVAAPVVSGIIADLDGFSQAQGNGRLGFVDPALYNLSNVQYSYLGVSIGHFPGFRNAFYDIYNGSNYQYSASRGYDLLTGLGQLNAGNIYFDISQNYSYAYFTPNGTVGQQHLLNLILFRILPIGAGAAVVAVASVFWYRKKRDT